MRERREREREREKREREGERGEKAKLREEKETLKANTNINITDFPVNVDSIILRRRRQLLVSLREEGTPSLQELLIVPLLIID